MIVLFRNQAAEPIFRQRLFVVGQRVKTPERYLGHNQHTPLIQVIEHLGGQRQVRQPGQVGTEFL